MKKILFYLEDIAIESKWALAVNDYTLIKNLTEVNDYDVQKTIVLVHIQNSKQDTNIIKELLKQQYFIILFTDTPSTEDAIHWFSKGIKGYLNSYASPVRIKQAINVVMAGNIWLGQTVMQAMIAKTYDRDKDNKGWIKLTSKKEQETMEHLLIGKSNKEIATLMYISERTVKSHVSNLFKLFNVKDRLGLVLHIKNYKD